MIGAATASAPWVLAELGLALLVGLAAVAWVRRRVDPRPLGRPVRSIRLSAQHAIHVVELEGSRLVLGTGPSGPPVCLMSGGELQPPPGTAEPVDEHQGWSFGD